MSSTPDAENTVNSRKRLVMSFVLVAACLVVGGLTFQWLADMQPPVGKRETAEKVYNVDAFVAQRVDVKEIISGFGTAKCDREVVISAQVDGEIVEIHPRLRVGAFVSDGTDHRTDDGQSTGEGADLLARVDPRPYQERVTQSQNRLDEAIAEIASLEQQVANNQQLLAKAQRDYSTFEKEYDRIKKSLSKGVATASDLTRSLLDLQKYQDNVLGYETNGKLLPLNIASARQRQRSLSNDLKLAQMELKKTEIRPRFSGRLSEVMIDLGQFVRIGEPISRVSDLNIVEVAVPLPLAEYEKLEAQVRSGDQPEVNLAPNETADSKWVGRLVRVAPEADAETRTVNVFVEVDNRDQSTPLLPGTFVNVRIHGPVFRDVVPIPRDAIQNGRVFVANKGKAKSREVQVTQPLQTLAIVSKVQPGEHVVLTNLDIIFEDAPVTIQRIRKLADELNSHRTQFARITPSETGTSGD
jgi:multidrug efflux pump subunit AcrA (membrane-fusion protein)